VTKPHDTKPSSTAELQAHLSISSTGESKAAHRKTIPN